MVEMWKVLGNASSSDLIPPGTTHANRLLMSCDAPLWHPYIVSRTSELLIHHAGGDPRGTLLASRKTVMMLPRTDGSEMNGGRK